MKQIYIIILSVLFCCCTKQETALFPKQHVISERFELIRKLYSPCYYESIMIKHGLVDVRQIEPSIEVDLMYARENNFLSKNVYECLKKAYLIPEIALKMQKAQELLKAEYPEYSLIIYDAARPLEVQQIMWNALDLPIREKVKYLSNPQKGSVHNFGCAVDVSIINENKIPLDMGTEVDYFGILAQPISELQCLKNGLLSEEQYSKRLLLRRTMQNAGFGIIEHEWWHFNGMSRQKAIQTLSILK